MLRHVKMRQSIKNKPTNNQERVGEQHSQIWRRGQERLGSLETTATQSPGEVGGKAIGKEIMK